MRLLSFLMVLLFSVSSLAVEPAVSLEPPKREWATITVDDGDGRSHSISSSKITRLTGDVNLDMLSRYVSDFKDTLHEKGDRIMIIDSPGGSVLEGERIIKLMKLEKAFGNKIQCFVTNRSHSMAANIMAHCSGRYAIKDAKMVFHKVRVFYFGVLTSPFMKKISEMLEKTNKPYAKKNAKLLKLTDEQYDKIEDEEKMWTAEELQSRGYLKIATLNLEFKPL